MSEESVQSQQDSKTESSPDKKSPPEDAPSPPEGSPAPPQGSPPPPTEGEKTPPPASSSNDKAPPVSPSSSSPPASTPPPDSTHSPTPSPPKTEVSSSPPVSPPPSEGSSKPTPPSQESPTSPVSPPPAPNFDAAQTPKASPNHPSPPTSSDKSPEFSPPPPISPSAESIPTPPASNVPAPPAQITSPPSDKSPPKAVPSPQTPGSPPATSTQTPTPSNVPSSTSTTPASQTPNYVPKLSHPSTQSSSDSSTPSGSSTSSKSSTTSGGGAIVGITLAGVVIIAFFAFFVARRRKRKREEAYIAQYKPSSINFSGQPEGYYYHPHQHTGGTDSYYGGKPPAAPPLLNSYGSHTGYSPGAPDASVMGSKSSFSYEELTEITNGFSRQNLLGEGGFGYVYKGWLQDGRVVAVKQLKAGSGQGEREFQAEVEIISRVHHRHLVSLVGYCIAEHQRLLVYEFVPNNTLDHHLHGKGIPVMEWSKRVKIALGAARGLAYLHEDCHPKIIHRDIKSSNILLDDVFEAQVSDFGLAKLTTDTHTHVSTRVMGTFGYMAPEYASSGKLTDRSDVFSFGVMLLEILTGRKPVDPNQPFGDESLVEWARPLLIHALESGDFEEIVDPRLEKRYVESEMFRMIETASACVRHSAQKRPRMSQVVRALDTEGEMGDISNGVKVGQSTVFEKGQHSTDIQKFRMLAFGSDDSSEYNSGENNSKEWSSASGGKLLR